MVFQALAVDPDDPATPNGRLTYKFLDDGTLGTDHASFEIRKCSCFKICTLYLILICSCRVRFIYTDPATGLVTTKARLDRESKASYTLILVARDQGNPPQQATRRLHVNVRDIDDHPSQFIRTPVCSGEYDLLYSQKICN